MTVRARGETEGAGGEAEGEDAVRAPDPLVPAGVQLGHKLRLLAETTVRQAAAGAHPEVEADEVLAELQRGDLAGVE